MHKPPQFIFEPVETEAVRSLVNAPLPKSTGFIAPIGYGKTVAMTQLYQLFSQRGIRCHWVGLDEHTDTTEKIVAAIQGVNPSLHRRDYGTNEAQIGPTRSLQEVIEHLMAQLAEIKEEVIYFLDNLNACRDQHLPPLIDALIFRTGDNIRFIGSSNVRPAFNYGKATLHGLYRQIGTDMLSLDARATLELLGDCASADLSLDDIEHIAAKTEGWPAAVRLAQILLNTATDKKSVLPLLSGNDQGIANMLKHQILAKANREFREFLLYLGQLRLFSREMCRHLLSESLADKYIDLLIDRNVFIVPLDNLHNEYRLHTFLRQFLRNEAQQHLSDEARRDFLSRASRWCEARQQWHDAVEYAFAAGALDRVSALLTSIGSEFVREQGDIDQHRDWIMRLIQAGEPISLETHYWLVWALVFQRSYEKGRIEYLNLCERYQSLPKDFLVAKDFQQRMDHIHMTIDLFTDNLPDAEASSGYAISKGLNHDPYTLSSVMCIHAICQANQFRFAAARAVMVRAEPIMRELGGEYSAGWINLILGLIANLEGHHEQALNELEEGIENTRRCFGGESALTGSLMGIAANSLVELGRVDKARQYLEVFLKTLNSNLLLDSAALGIEAAIKLWSPTSEDICLVELQAAARKHPPRLSVMFSCELIRRMISLGLMDQAQAEAVAIGLDPAVPQKSVPLVAHITPRLAEKWQEAQLALLFGLNELRPIHALLQIMQEAAKQCGRQHRLVDVELKMAILHHLSGKPAMASKAFVSAFRRAAKIGLLQPFVDKQEVCVHILKNSRIMESSFAIQAEKQVYRELLDRLGLAVDQLDSQPRHAPIPAVAGPLTRKESELLELLCRGLSNADIANYSYVSLDTVKWHLKNLYKKLGVANRTAAVSYGRELGLIE